MSKTIVTQNLTEQEGNAGVNLDQLNTFLNQAGYAYAEHYIDAHLAIPQGVNHYNKAAHTAVFTMYTDVGIRREVDEGFTVLGVHIYAMIGSDKRPIAVLGDVPGVDVGEELAQQLFLFQPTAALVGAMA